jgi:hypothetical protein
MVCPWYNLPKAHPMVVVSWLGGNIGLRECSGYDLSKAVSA